MEVAELKRKRMARKINYFEWLKDRQELFTVSVVEKFCGFGHGVVARAIREGFEPREVERLKKLYDICQGKRLTPEQRKDMADLRRLLEGEAEERRQERTPKK